MNTNIYQLPEEMVKEIYAFVPNWVKVYLNKKYYLKYHKFIKRKCMKHDGYFRNIIRLDFDFIFQQSCSENMKQWLLRKQYKYKNNVFLNYAYLLEHLCIETESTKCRNILHFYIKKSGLNKNQHKKKVSKVIQKEWSN
uniref:Uncharacterized protein n=1 Tax=viral metagenome TaxID=1070528 RepID=A0A6C0B9G1_9ZZZZ